MVIVIAHQISIIYYLIPISHLLTLLWPKSLQTMMVWRIPHPIQTLLFRNNSKQCLDGQVSYLRIVLHAEVAKLADALASGASSRKGVEVQVLSSAF